MTSLGELAGLSRADLIRRLRDAEARAERAEMRLACWALAEAFDALDLDTDHDGRHFAEPCRCGHPRDQHVACECECDLCGCRAFVAAEPTP